MRPILMIENLKNLHDARYCAAVGISLVSFEMDERVDGALSVAQVREIVDWLSGVECIGKLGEQLVHDPAPVIDAAGINWVQVPMHFPGAALQHLAANLIVDATQAALDPAWLNEIQSVSLTQPKALFLIQIKDAYELASLGETGLLARCILRFDDPNSIYHQLRSQGLQPYGFSLGEFAIAEDGELDYDACDLFLEQFAALAMA